MTRALARRYLLEKIYSQLSDEDRRTFVLMTIEDRSAGEILREIRANRQHLERLVRHAESDRWYTAFGSDVAANVLTTSVFWLLGKLFSK